MLVTERGERVLLWILGRILIEIVKHRKHGGIVDRESEVRISLRSQGVEV
jgi:hypothetical protein